MDSAQRNIRVYKFQLDGTLRNGRISGEESGNKGEGIRHGKAGSRQPLCDQPRRNFDLGFGWKSPYKLETNAIG
jgi:hypothetical protein